MGINEKDRRVYEVLVAVTAIPKHIVMLHGIDNVTEFLLHDLAKKDCFNFSKAAYFIDNPDFDHLKGIAGFTQVDSYRPRHDHWSEAQAFTDHMKAASFNTKVRDMCRCSMKKNKHNAKEVVQELSQVLQFSDPQYLMWPIKYDNHGLLLFEKNEQEKEIDEHLERALNLFGFCPVF